MSLRAYIHKLENEKKLLRVSQTVSKALEMAAILKQCEPNPVLFEKVQESGFPVIGNLFCSKADLADYFGIQVSEIIPLLLSAIQNRSPSRSSPTQPARKWFMTTPTWICCPFCSTATRMAALISVRVWCWRTIRCMGRMRISTVACSFQRQKWQCGWSVTGILTAICGDQKAVDVAICIGNAPNILVAAATSVDLGVNELEIAHALEPFDVVRAKTSNLLIPAETEFVYRRHHLPGQDPCRRTVCGSDGNL